MCLAEVGFSWKFAQLAKEGIFLWTLRWKAVFPWPCTVATLAQHTRSSEMVTTCQIPAANLLFLQPPTVKKSAINSHCDFLRWNTGAHSSTFHMASEKVSNSAWQESPTSMNCSASLLFQWLFVRKKKSSLFLHSQWIWETNSCQMTSPLSLETCVLPRIRLPAAWSCESNWMWLCVWYSQFVMQREENWCVFHEIPLFFIHLFLLWRIRTLLIYSESWGAVWKDSFLQPQVCPLCGH